MASGSVQTGTAAAGVLQTLREIPAAPRFVLLGVLINQIGAFLQFFMVLYLLDRGFSPREAGLALGAYSVGAILGVLFGGGLSDRLGPRWTIVASIGSAALFTLSVTGLSSLPAIMVAVAAAGAMTQAARPAATSLLLSYVPPARQVMTVAMYRAVLNGGMVVGPLIATGLSAYSWNLVFWFDAATAMVYCLIAAFLLPRHRPADPAGQAGEPSPRVGYLTVLRDRRYLGYLALMLGNGLLHVQFFAVLPVQLTSAGYPTWAYATAAAVSAAIVIGTELLVTRRTQLWPAWIAVNVGWVLVVIGRGGFGLPGGFTVILVITIIAAVGQIIGGPAAFAYPAKVAPPGAVGRYLGSAHALFQLGYVIGPVLGIALWTNLGSGFWALCFVFGLLMLVPGVWAMRPTGAGN